MQKKKKKIKKKKKRKEKEKRRDYNIYKAVLCYNYIIDKAVWSSSPGLRCQSCCNENIVLQRRLHYKLIYILFPV